jgi:diguanylate cyclase (GGDEF)-like protein
MTAASTRVECLDQARRATLRSAPMGPPAATLLALTLGDSVDWPRKALFIALVTIANAWGFTEALMYTRRRRAGHEPSATWPLLAYAIAMGVAWASITVIGFPSAHHVELRTVIALFIAGVSATSVVQAASMRVVFWASQVPLVGVTTLVFITDGDRVTRMVGLAMPIYFGVMAMLHLEVNRTVVSEIELKHANEDLVADLIDVAMRDHLTGVASRAAFVERLEAAVASAQRHDHTVGVIYFDIDRFKIVNDSLGHAAGDELLVELARRVHTVLRPNDVIGRLGGDEFVVVLEGLGDPYEAVLVARRLLDVVAAPFDLGGRMVLATVSIGVATNLHRKDGAADLLRHADAAQYRAKQSGGDRMEVFDIELRRRVLERLDLERELTEGLQRGEIVPFYQPIINLATGEVVGAEALARWKHPTRGLRGAHDFMDLANEVGLIVGVDITVMVQAIRDRVALDEAGVDPSFRMWCNISPRQLTRGNPVERLAAFLETVGCPASAIGVEITETGVLVDVVAAARELAAARRLGVRVALDDFGTGHSSLTLLRDLPIDEVKIDRSFVRDVVDDPADAAIVGGITDLAHRLGLGVIAEGVEDAVQEAALRRLGCERVQGYRYGVPMPFDVLVARMGLDRATVPTY